MLSSLVCTFLGHVWNENDHVKFCGRCCLVSEVKPLVWSINDLSNQSLQDEYWKWDKYIRKADDWAARELRNEAASEIRRRKIPFTTRAHVAPRRKQNA